MGGKGRVGESVIGGIFRGRTGGSCYVLRLILHERVPAVKRMFQILAITVLATQMASAGTDSNVEFGLKAGTYWSVGTRARGQVGYPASVRSETGLCGGMTVTQKFSKVLALQFEALYLDKKVGLTHENNVAPLGIIKVDQYRFQVLEFPLLFKVTPRIGSGKFRGSIYTGPYFGFLYSAKAIYNGYVSEEYDGERDISKVNKGFDWGIAGGIEVGREVGNGELFLDARYDLGLLNMRPDKVYSNPYPMWVENIRGMVISVGYRFRM
jgi:hypothetical protein